VPKPHLFLCCCIKEKEKLEMNYAIVEASGRQFWVESGRFYDFNSLNLNPGDKIALTRVLLVNENGNVSVGKQIKI